MKRIGEVDLFVIGVDGRIPSSVPAPLPPEAQDVLRATTGLYASSGFREPWVCYLAVAAGRVVGTCGFKSAPAGGRAEIAYFTFPEFEGRGVASAMARSLVAVAQREDPEVRIAAQTLADRNASHRVLEKLGFRHVDTLEDPEDGTLWEWRLPRADIPLHGPGGCG